MRGSTYRRRVGVCVVILGGVLAAGAAGAAMRIDNRSHASAGVGVASGEGQDSLRTVQVWRVREDLRLGSLEHGPAAELFGFIRDVEADDDGNVYILDSQNKEVRVFDRDGRHVRTFGREGAGPGEFQNPAVLKWTLQDELLVFDNSRRFLTFDTAGGLVRSVSGGFVPGGFSAQTSAFDENGRFFHAATLFPAPGAFPLDRPEVILGLDEAMQPVDTISLPHFERPSWTWSARDGTSSSRVFVPFAPRRRWSFDETGHIWFAISDEYRLFRQTVQGDTLQIIEREVTPLPVSAEEKAEALDDIRKRRSQVPIDPDEVPAFKPVIDGFIVDDQGYLWVNSTTADPQAAALAAEPDVRVVYDVFAPEGRFVGYAAVEVPGRIMRIRGSAVYLRTTDEYGVHYLVRGRISGR